MEIRFRKKGLLKKKYYFLEYNVNMTLYDVNAWDVKWCKILFFQSHDCIFANLIFKLKNFLIYSNFCNVFYIYFYHIFTFWLSLSGLQMCLMMFQSNLTLQLILQLISKNSFKVQLVLLSFYNNIHHGIFYVIVLELHVKRVIYG